MAVAQIGVAGIDMKGRLVDIVDAVGGLEKCSVVLAVRIDGHIDPEMDEVPVVEEGIQFAGGRSRGWVLGSIRELHKLELQYHLLVG